MSPPDEKQNRLSTLSQDVIAVSGSKKAADSRPASPPRAPERTQERKAIPAAQDVFNVPSAAPAPAASPRPAWQPPAAAARGPSSALTWAALLLGIAALAVSVYATRTALVPAAPQEVNDPRVLRLDADLKAVSERLAKLEMRLNAAATADAKSAGPAGQASFLQLSAGLRELRDNLDRLANEQARLTAQIGEVRGATTAAARDARTALGQAEQAGARVAALGEQAARTPAPAAAGADAQAQLRQLTQKTDKMAADIRQLYRLLGTQ